MTNLSNQRGVGLIEVMVALLLLTVAVLGYTALQGKAIQATNESFERSQSLVMMRNIAEKIHANPSAIEIYEENLNKSYASSSAPSEKCGLEGVAADFCSPEQLAVAESYNLKTKLQNYDFQIQMHPCPNTGGTGTDAADNIMFSYCLISAWGETTPTIGTDDESDCLTERVVGEAAGGNYHPKATCMMMEI
ncbi:type IV pilus modification protein PilV [Psychrobacter pocilloporae]|uniref:Type IV pilus modification protein PilV n=1 Tax=Psychrobacter pocilloporae TaxID=1775882 RepID=A0ABT6IS88_9GAMM|nr:type IV pilus modification protein PilV [Psychrobacter pocilloporae]MDH4903917.1 type IV pilus modification protein PilV [Psychrobacter pocilloporae]